VPPFLASTLARVSPTEQEPKLYGEFSTYSDAAGSLSYRKQSTLKLVALYMIMGITEDLGSVCNTHTNC
jgi:hypothetical protein